MTGLPTPFGGQPLNISVDSVTFPGQRPARAPFTPQGPGDVEMQRLLAQDRANADKLFFAEFVEASKFDPDKAAEVRKLGIEVDGKLDEETIENNLDEVRQFNNVLRMKRLKLAAGDSVLRRQLRDPAFARLAHDQVEEMGTFEALFSNIRAGWKQNEIGKLGSSVVGGKITAEKAGKLAGLRTEVAQLTNDDLMFFSPASRLVGQISESVPTMLAAGAVGAAVGSVATPVGAAAGFGYGVTAGLAIDSYRVNSGHLYLQMMEQGYSVESATRSARAAGVINAGLEVLGAKALTGTARVFLKKKLAERAGQVALAPIKVSSTVMARLKQYAIAGGGETATEVAQEMVNIYEEEVARLHESNQNAVHPETGEPLTSTWTRGEAAQVLVDTALEVAEGMAVLGLSGPGFGVVHDRKEFAKVEQTQQFLGNLKKGVDVQKVNERSPDLFQNYIRDLADGQPVERMRINTSDLQQVLDEAGVSLEQVQRDLPEIAKQIEHNSKFPEVAMDVVIPVEKLASEIAPRTKLFDAMKPHLRAEGDHKSMAELEAEKEHIAERTEEIGRAIDEDLESHDAQVDAAREIQRDLAAGMIATGKLSDDKASAVARQYRQFFVKLAMEHGEDPLHFYEKHRPRFQFGDPSRPNIPVFDPPAPKPEPTPEQAAVRETVPDWGAAIPEFAKLQGGLTPQKFANLVEQRMQGKDWDALSAEIPEIREGQRFPKKRTKKQANRNRVIAKRNLLRMAKGYAEDAGLWTKPEMAQENALLRSKKSAEILPWIKKAGGLSVEQWKSLGVDIDSRGEQLVKKGLVRKSVNGRWEDFAMELKADGFLDGYLDATGEEVGGGDHEAAMLLAVNDALDGVAVIGGEAGQNIEAMQADADKQAARQRPGEDVDGWQPGESDALFQDGQRKTDTPEFKAFFGGSQVVDNGGAPLRVFHETSAEFSEFQRGADSDFSYGDAADSGGFFFFTDAKATGGARRGSRTIPVYLSIKNPAVIEDGQSLQDQAKALHEAERDGHDGARIGGQWVAFRPEQIKSVNNRGTFDPTSPNILRQDDTLLAEGSEGPLGSYVDRMITVGEQAKVHTFIHEGAHLFLDIYNEMGRAPNAPPLVKQSLRTLIDWMGFEGDTLDTLSKKQWTELHEAFAYNFEVFAATGEVASPELKTVYQRFKVWLNALYDSIRTDLNKIYRRNFKRDLPALTGEVRLVMDRMLASEEQVTRAEGVRDAAPMFRTQEESGKTDDEWAEHLEARVAAHSDAVDELSRKNIQSTEYAAKIRSTREREIGHESRARRAEIRAEVKPAVAKEKISRLRQVLRTGKLTDENGQEVEHALGDNTRLNTEAVRAVAPELNLRTLGGVTSPEGVDPALMADLFGYEDTITMLRDLAETPKEAARINAAVQERMDRDFPELSNPEIMEAAVMEAVHNEARMRVIEQELAAVSDTPTAVQAAAAKRVARERIEQTEIRDLRPDLMHHKEVQARREALRLFRKGDREGASAALSREMVYAHMARDAYAAKAEIERKRQQLRKFFVGNAQIAKAREINIVNVARSVLSWAGLGSATKHPNEYVRELELYEPEVAAGLSVELQRAQRDGVDDHRKLTVHEFRVNVQIAEDLWEQSRRAKQLEVADKLIDQDDAAEAITGQLRKTNPEKERPGQRSAVSTRQKKWRGVLGYLARYRRFEHWAYANDGGKKGVLWQYLGKPVFDAINRYKTQRDGTTRVLSNELRKLKLPHGAVHAPDLGYTFGRGSQSGMAELLGAIMHAGTKSSQNRLVGSEIRQWGEVDEDGNADATQFWNTVQSLIDSGKLKEEHLDFVQMVWDTNESIKPLMQRAAKIITGFFAKELEAQPFTVTLPDGREKTYRGGYSAATYDAIVSKHGKRIADQTELQTSDLQSRLNLTPSFVKERVDGFKDVLDLDIRRAVMNFDGVMRWAHIAPAVRDVQALVLRDDVGDFLKVHQPGTVENLIAPWLNRAITQSTFVKADEADGFFTKMRTGVGSSIMMGNYSNAAQQLSGFMLSGTRISKPKLLAGMMKAKLPEVHKFIMDSSESMRHMGSAGSQELTELMHQLFEKQGGPLNELNAFMKRNAYFMQQATQGYVNQATWIAAYDDYMASDTNREVNDEDAHSAAVEHADGVVRMTQGSLDPESVPGYEKGSAIKKMFTQFGGYFNTLANLAADEYVLKVRAMGGLNVANSARLLYAWMGIIMAPAMVAEMIMMTAKGEWWEEGEEDGIADEAMQILFMAPAKTAVAMAPFPFNQGAMALVNTLDPKPWNDRMLQAPAITTLESFALKTLPDLAEGDVKARHARDIAMMAAMMSGTPWGAVGNITAKLAK